MTGSLNFSLPSWASSTISAAVKVLVFEAIRKWVSAAGGDCRAEFGGADGRSIVSLRGAQDDHRAGNVSSFAAASTTAWKAARSMGLSAEEPGGALGMTSCLRFGSATHIDMRRDPRPLSSWPNPRS